MTDVSLHQHRRWDDMTNDSARFARFARFDLSMPHYWKTPLVVRFHSKHDSIAAIRLPRQLRQRQHLAASSNTLHVDRD